MDDYRWFDFDNASLPERFPTGSGWEWLVGAREWADGVNSRAFTNRERALQWLDNIRQARPQSNANLCPRVFVSHRQTDQKAALRIAYLAARAGFYYWLDLHHLDRALDRQIKAEEATLRRPLKPPEKSRVLAAVIEMALVNCTHVIAAMTSKTRGSQWVPYEYGRVEDATRLYRLRACWWDTTSLPKEEDLAEYLHLAGVYKKERTIRQWFKTELSQFNSCTRPHPKRWSGPKTNRLPTG